MFPEAALHGEVDLPDVLAAASLLSFAVAVIATPLFRDVAIRRGELDFPNERSSHTRPTPRNGGYAIVLGIGVAYAAAARSVDRSLAVLAAAVLMLAIVAVIDERRGLAKEIRLAAHALAALGLALFAGQVSHLELPWTGAIPLAWAAIPLTVLWLVGVMNAYNFMDGLNGIAAIEAIVAGVTLAMLLLRHGDPAAAAIAFAAAAAAAGFLPWNLPSGSVFMGDTGSMALGTILAMLIVRASGGGVPFIAAALPLAPFLADTAVTLIRRIVRGERFTEAHRSHYYQRLQQQGLSHAAVSLTWGALAAVSSIGALLYERLSDGQRAGVLAIVLVMHAAVFLWIDGRRRGRVPTPAARSRHRHPTGT